MKYLKKLGKALLYALILSISLTFFITIFSYFNLFNDNIIKIFKFLIPIISVFISGIIMGRSITKKAFIEGLKLGIIIITILTTISLITNSLKIECILFYLIIVISTIFGSMVGILKKTN